MIHDVDIDTSPMSAGEVRRMIVRSTGPLTVAIKCFVGRPPPPGYKTCPECGTFSVKSGQPVDVVANSRIFRSASGQMDVIVTDTSDNDTRHITISASTASSEGGATTATA